jgi:hypothetical protein
MYKRGDIVRVKHLNKIYMTLDTGGRYKGTDLYFPEQMIPYCGKTYQVVYVLDDRVSLEGNNWSWHFDWIEPLEIDNRRVEYV